MTRIAVMSEDDLLSAVIELAHWRKWLVYHVRRSDRAIVQGDTGFPDLLLCRGRRLLAVELKSATGSLSPAQVDWLAALNAAGARTFVWRPSDWLDGTIERVLL